MPSRNQAFARGRKAKITYTKCRRAKTTSPHNTQRNQNHMGRQAATIEYLEKLVYWAGGTKAFCQKTGVHQPNLSAYLAGYKRILLEKVEVRNTLRLWRATSVCPSNRRLQ